MTAAKKALLLAAMTISTGFIDCQKKVTKVESPAPVTEKPATETAKPPPLAPLEEFKPIDMDAQAREALQTIYFDFDKYDLRPDAITKMETIAKFLQEHTTLRVLAEGHCDERGSSDYNMALGENRADAAKRYLVSYGIDPHRLETTSYGKERPVRTGCGNDEVCNQANRRVEWKVLAK
jgi:peptidoglycan-associated lipoprotein